MLVKFICLVLGHQMTEWFSNNIDSHCTYRYCERCGKVEWESK
jgi:hypothetical protein